MQGTALVCTSGNGEAEALRIPRHGFRELVGWGHLPCPALQDPIRRKRGDSAISLGFAFSPPIITTGRPRIDQQPSKNAAPTVGGRPPEHCNSLYVGIADKTINRLQMVQNAAARVLTGTKMREHISPVLASLHWLPVRFRVKFKTLLFVYKALNGLAPAYIKELITRQSSERSLRSNDQFRLKVPKTEKKT